MSWIGRTAIVLVLGAVVSVVPSADAPSAAPGEKKLDDATIERILKIQELSLIHI